MPPELALEAMRSRGMPEWFAGAMVEVMAHIRTGAAATTTSASAAIASPSGGSAARVRREGSDEPADQLTPIAVRAMDGQVRRLSQLIAAVERLEVSTKAEAIREWVGRSVPMLDEQTPLATIAATGCDRVAAIAENFIYPTFA